MELKKNPKISLEKWKSIFFQVGLIVSIVTILAAFNISTEKGNVDEFAKNEGSGFEEPVIPITRQKEPEQLKPPPPKTIIEELNIVKNDTKLKKELEIGSNEVDENTKIQFKKIEEPIEKPEPHIFTIVEDMPKFPGGDVGLIKYIAKHTKYPNIAREGGIEGKVYIRFCVTNTGLVKKVSVARGVDPLLNNEAIRVVKSLPKWKPGEQSGKKVNVWFTVPINFRLQ